MSSLFRPSEGYGVTEESRKFAWIDTNRKMQGQNCHFDLLHAVLVDLRYFSEV